MTARFEATNYAEAQAMQDAAKAAREDEAKRAAANPVKPTVYVPQSGRVTFRDGQMTSQSSVGATSVALPGQLRNGHVVLRDGTEMTYEAAKNAGLTDIIVQASDDVARSFKAGSSQAQAVIQAETKGQDEEAATLAGATEGDAANIRKAAETIAQASEAIGATAVAAYQQDVVASGELPTDLPQGVTPEMVKAVADGYVSQANTVLRDVGTNVETLTALSNENELRDARLAVFRGNDAALRDLGSRAQSRLHTLPDDPVMLKELTWNWPEDIKVVQREGVWWIESPTRGEIKWSDAVDQGKLYVK